MELDMEFHVRPLIAEVVAKLNNRWVTQSTVAGAGVCPANEVDAPGTSAYCGAPTAGCVCLNHQCLPKSFTASDWKDLVEEDEPQFRSIDASASTGKQRLTGIDLDVTKVIKCGAQCDIATELDVANEVDSTHIIVGGGDNSYLHLHTNLNPNGSIAGGAGAGQDSIEEDIRAESLSNISPALHWVNFSPVGR
jgi:hypothetical protein